MDVRRLEVLRELRLRGSLAAVAAATHRTPSAVSQQLKALQREVGAVLTERAGRGLVLTPEGEALAAAASEVAIAIARAEEVWRTYVDSPQGTVDLAVFPTAGRMFLPALLAEARRTPGLAVIASDVDPADGDFAALVADVDVVVAYAVGPVPSWHDRAITARHLVDEPLDVALPAGHPLAARTSVGASDVADEVWLGPPADFPFDRVLREIERVAGRPLRVAQRFADTRIVESLVAAGEGLAILPRFTSGGPDSGVVLRPLDGIAPARTIAALTRVETAERPSVQVVLAALESIGAALGDDRAPIRAVPDAVGASPRGSGGSSTAS